jgi:hypothetical protein
MISTLGISEIVHAAEWTTTIDPDASTLVQEPTASA